MSNHSRYQKLSESLLSIFGNKRCMNCRYFGSKVYGPTKFEVSATKQAFISAGLDLDEVENKVRRVEDRYSPGGFCFKRHEHFSLKIKADFGSCITAVELLKVVVEMLDE